MKVLDIHNYDISEISKEQQKLKINMHNSLATTMNKKTALSGENDEITQSMYCKKTFVNEILIKKIKRKSKGDRIEHYIK